MGFIHTKILLISLGVTVGLYLAYRGYKYFIASKRKAIFVPRLVLHSLERFVSSGEVVFHFEVTEEQDVVFEVCNAGFEPVAELQRKTLGDGSYTLPFDTTSLPNGEYFYRLKGEGQQVMKKFEIRN